VVYAVDTDPDVLAGPAARAAKEEPGSVRGPGRSTGTGNGQPLRPLLVAVPAPLLGQPAADPPPGHLGRPALLAITGVLGDQRQPVSAAALRQLKTFLCQTSRSPLFGDDPGAAHRAAQQLQYSFTGHPEP
jgi:hypothetical protein